MVLTEDDKTSLANVRLSGLYGHHHPRKLALGGRLRHPRAAEAGLRTQPHVPIR